MTDYLSDVFPDSGLKTMFFIMTIVEVVILSLGLIVIFIIISNRAAFGSFMHSYIIFCYFTNAIVYGNSFITTRIPLQTAGNGTIAEYFPRNCDNGGSVCDLLIVSHAMHYNFAYAQYFFHFLVSFYRYMLIYHPAIKALKWNTWKLFPQKFSLLFFIILLLVPLSISNFLILTSQSYYVHHQEEDYFTLETSAVRTIKTDAEITYRNYTLLSESLKNLYLPVKCFSSYNYYRYFSEFYDIQEIKESKFLHLWIVFIAIIAVDFFLTILTVSNMIIAVYNLEKQYKGILFFIPYANDVLIFHQPFLFVVSSMCQKLSFCKTRFKIHKLGKHLNTRIHQRDITKF
ncbi:hypothetical protein CRE_27625 [Caenorhabditis remanei]|uniref:Serpentine receptor class gamma n=1 Tax=Caenorhabditis remanei TaxID=31234 RepID=E3MKK7_CAERE|nr:hypothetical protein CRE_27625 [Caenorhabditis remanei]